MKNKKLVQKICIFFILGLVFAATITANANNIDTAPPTETIDNGFDEESFFDKLKDFFSGGEEETSGLNPEGFIESINKGANLGFAAIRYYITNSGQTFGFIDTTAIVKTLTTVFLPFGYLIFMISWGIGVGNKSISLELYDGKELIKAGIMLVVGFAIIGSSQAITGTIINISNGIANELLVQAEFDISSLQPPSSFNSFISNVPFVGELYKLIKFTFGMDNMSVIVLNILLYILSLIINIQLGIRIVKLAIFQGVAPVFFAFVGDKSTSNYTKNFIVQFSLIAFKLVFVTVIYNVFQISFMSWVNSTITGTSSGYLSGFILMFVFGILILKAETIFDKIFMRG